MTTTALPQYQTFRAGLVSIVFDPRPTGGAIVQVRDNGTCTYAEHFTTIGEAQTAYDERVTEHTPQLEVGEQTVSTVDRITVTVQRVMPLVYAVWTEQGSYRVDTYSRSYPTQTEAYTARDHTLHAFATYGTIDAIEARTAELVPQLLAQTSRRGPTARAAERRISQELYGLASLAERAGLADIADELATFLNAA